MTIHECIARLDEEQPNAYRYEEKLHWLSRLDGMVQHRILDCHVPAEGEERSRFEGYDTVTDPDTELLVPAPFDGLYLRWLEAMIHYHNGEIVRYNNAMLLFRAAWDACFNDYRRTHLPCSPGRYLF